MLGSGRGFSGAPVLLTPRLEEKVRVPPITDELVARQPAKLSVNVFLTWAESGSQFQHQSVTACKAAEQCGNNVRTAGEVCASARRDDDAVCSVFAAVGRWAAHRSCGAAESATASSLS